MTDPEHAFGPDPDDGSQHDDVEERAHTARMAGAQKLATSVAALQNSFGPLAEHINRNAAVIERLKADLARTPRIAVTSFCGSSSSERRRRFSHL